MTATNHVTTPVTPEVVCTLPRRYYKFLREVDRPCLSHLAGAKTTKAYTAKNATPLSRARHLLEADAMREELAFRLLREQEAVALCERLGGDRKSKALRDMLRSAIALQADSVIRAGLEIWQYQLRSQQERDRDFYLREAPYALTLHEQNRLLARRARAMGSEERV